MGKSEVQEMVQETEGNQPQGTHKTHGIQLCARQVQALAVGLAFIHEILSLREVLSVNKEAEGESS